MLSLAFPCLFSHSNPLLPNSRLPTFSSAPRCYHPRVGSRKPLLASALHALSSSWPSHHSWHSLPLKMPFYRSSRHKSHPFLPPHVILTVGPAVIALTFYSA